MEAIRDGILKGTKNDRKRLVDFLKHKIARRQEYHRDRSKRLMPSLGPGVELFAG